MNWISVKDNLPERDKKVLVIDVYGQQFVAEFDKDYKIGDFLNYSICCGCNTCEVTHWKPLDEPPKENNL